MQYCKCPACVSGAVPLGAEQLCVLQVSTEMVLGLPQDQMTPEVLAHQQKLFETFLDGFVALPFNFPGTG